MIADHNKKKGDEDGDEEDGGDDKSNLLVQSKTFSFLSADGRRQHLKVLHR